MKIMSKGSLTGGAIAAIIAAGTLVTGLGIAATVLQYFKCIGIYRAGNALTKRTEIEDKKLGLKREILELNQKLRTDKKEELQNQRLLQQQKLFGILSASNFQQKYNPQTNTTL